MASVEIRSAVKKFGDLEVIHGISLAIEDGEFMVFVGPSGCGKSTLLRMVAGLESAQGGEIVIGDSVVNHLPARDRDIAMVFQDYALYPHMSVSKNLTFALRMQGRPSSEVETKLKEVARILQIEPLLERRPRELSGGQRQRVAMGRAIIREPRVFLFDEPLSNLDAKLRVEMRSEIKRLHQRIGTTMIYVTHDQVEAMTLADRIVVLRDGYVEQLGTPDEIYNTPANLFVASFIGSPAMNFVAAEVISDGGKPFLKLVNGDVLPVPDHRVAALDTLDGNQVLLGIRPEHFSAATGNGADNDDRNGVTVTVDVIEPLGSDTLLLFRMGDNDMVARVAPSTRAAPGQSVRLDVDLDAFHLFDPASGVAL